MKASVELQIENHLNVSIHTQWLYWMKDDIGPLQLLVPLFSIHIQYNYCMKVPGCQSTIVPSVSIHIRPEGRMKAPLQPISHAANSFNPHPALQPDEGSTRKSFATRELVSMHIRTDGRMKGHCHFHCWHFRCFNPHPAG